MITYTDRSILDRCPYVYAILWTSLNRAYVGLRFAKNCHPSELWVSYFTSSLYVSEFRKQHGEPDHIEIIDTFLTAQQAILAEKDLIETFSLHTNPVFLNKGCHGAIHMDEDVRAKISKAHIGKQVSEETRNKISKIAKARSGRCHSNETKAKMSSSGKNRVFSEDSRAKMSKSAKGRLISAEAKANMAKSQLGKTRSQETRDKISAAHKGRKFSEETLSKMRASALSRKPRQKL